MDAAGLSSEVELYKGDGYTFITFRNSVFFDGDSSVIREEGKVIFCLLYTSYCAGNSGRPYRAYPEISE